MKPSPLQLEWVSYPALHFDARPEDGKGNIATTVKAQVVYYTEGLHAAEVHIESRQPDAAYAFSVHAVAAFGLDLELALAAYKCPPEILPRIVAANVSRVLYSGARELLATATARGPHGPAMIESVLIEPADVIVGSVEPMEDVMRAVFKVAADDPPTVKVETPARKPRRRKA